MIIEDTAEKLVEIQWKNPLLVIAILTILTLIIITGTLQLEIKPSTEAVLPKDDPVVESLDTLRAKFSGDTTYIIIQDTKDIRKYDFMNKIQRIENQAKTLENVMSTTSPAKILNQKYNKIPQDQQKIENTNYQNLITTDKKSAIISLRTDTQANSKEIQKLYDQLHSTMQAEFAPQSYYLTGYNMIDLATFRVIINDFIRITGIAFLAIMIVLYIFFRKIKKIFLPLTPVLFALPWMLGLGGYLGANLTIISMVSAAMIMGLGIDFGVHVTRKYYNTEGGKEGLKETMCELSRGLLGGSTTTGIGFLALLLANLEGMHALGIFLFTGIISAYIGSVFLLPTIIVLMNKKSKEGYK